MGSITDGSSNTIMVGEQSDWCNDASGQEKDCRSCGLYGFPLGPAGIEWPAKVRAFNYTTVRYMINERDWEKEGIKDANMYDVLRSKSPHSVGASGRSQLAIRGRIGSFPR